MTDRERTPTPTRLMEIFVFLISGFWLMLAVVAIAALGVIALVRVLSG